MVEHNDAMRIESTTETPWVTVRDTENGILLLLCSLFVLVVSIGSGVTGLVWVEDWG